MPGAAKPTAENPSTETGAPVGDKPTGAPVVDIAPKDEKELENQSEGKRREFWTDAAGKLQRQIDDLRNREVAGTVWTIPAIIAMGAVFVALIVSFAAIYFVFKGVSRPADS